MWHDIRIQTRTMLRLTPSILAALCVSVVTPAFADSNLQVDFATIGQPGNAWTLGWITAPGQSITPFDQSVSNALDNTTTFQSSALGSDSPLIMQDADTGLVTLQSGAGGISVVRWTSSWTGVVNLNATFGADDQGVLNFSVFLLDHGWSIADWWPGIAGYEPAPSLNYQTLLTINEGQSVDFISYNKRASPLQVTMVLPVPDGGSTGMLLLLAAFVFIALAGGKMRMAKQW